MDQGGREGAQAAAEIAEAERLQRAEAQGLTEQLRAEGERRARVFNNAVKAAVAKIQNELESERDSLEQRWAHAPPPPFFHFSPLACSSEVALAAAAEVVAVVEVVVMVAVRLVWEGLVGGGWW